MKILTNIRFYHLAGISQATQSFISHVEKEELPHRIVGVDIEAGSPSGQQKRFTSAWTRFCYIHKTVPIPTFDVLKRTCQSVEDLKRVYKDVIQSYTRAIYAEKPDVILINGTYFLPWCLYQAAQSMHIPMVLHYHGILSKEIGHWRPSRLKKIFESMEQSFDDPSLFYVFPSELAKRVVEQDIFKHTIYNSTILPNPVLLPEDIDVSVSNRKKRKKAVGLVSRWTRIKNPLFYEKLAKHDLTKGDQCDFHIITDLHPLTKKRRELNGLLKFQPTMSQQKLRPFLRFLDVVISPSHFETYGNVSQEALACGTPALVSSNMGISETYKAIGLADWVIDFSSPSAVYKKIQEVGERSVPIVSIKKLCLRNAPQVVYRKYLSYLSSAAQ